MISTCMKFVDIELIFAVVVIRETKIKSEAENMRDIVDKNHFS